ncbi:group 4 capsule polysaccharide lipoprotein GfcB/YjbF [Marinomonas alcarazii]|uniref:Group 4 capsule polysaccharide lipoprotein GfcB/YjbF n=1 Tax=Marinomonas alcarazii TaxID=491949 RepID=A0A318UVB4_9GAMM|nr:YjbF family lipoprotein [Marinomonas alcarazii]PYF79873.1 group 4 capsule polysaccharide lipoprotein GfcB/YjbF [Marinomonas alcarazii]
MRFLRYFSMALILLALTGCSGNFKNSLDSAKAAINLNQAITPDYISSLPYASTLVTVNDSRPLLLILTFVDHDPLTNTYRLTWLTQDAGSIVTENGRIVHTTGFTSDNLDTLMPITSSMTPSSATSPSSTVATPFPKLASTTSWQARYDWSPGYRYNFTAQVTARSLGMDTVITDLWHQEAEQIQETVVFNNLDASFNNLFWLTPATETADPFVVKSIQYLGPNMDKVEMLMVKPFVPPRSNTRETKTKDIQS